MTRMNRFVLLAGASLAGLVALPGAASAGSRDWRHDDHDRDRENDVRIDINLGRPAPRYEERTTRVWVEPVYRTCSERVWVEPVYRTECDRVWIEPVYRDECERVWVPDRWERREVIHDHGRDRWTSCENVLVERGHWAEQHHRVLVSDGHWETRDRQVVVCEGHWETRDRQEAVTPGHWEYRTERARVDDGCEVNPWFDVFARLTR